MGPRFPNWGLVFLGWEPGFPGLEPEPQILELAFEQVTFPEPGLALVLADSQGHTESIDYPEAGYLAPGQQVFPPQQVLPFQ